jgi:hypothetical protein
VPSGYNRPPYLLALDHRRSFERDLFDVSRSSRTRSRLAGAEHVPLAARPGPALPVRAACAGTQRAEVRFSGRGRRNSARSNTKLARDRDQFDIPRPKAGYLRLLGPFSRTSPPKATCTAERAGWLRTIMSPPPNPSGCRGAEQFGSTAMSQARSAYGAFSASISWETASIRARWVKAWGKFPRCSPLLVSISSA